MKSLHPHPGAPPAAPSKDLGPESSSGALSHGAVDPIESSALAFVVAAARSLATYVALSVYVLLVAPPGILAAMLFRSKSLLYALGHAGVRLALGLSGIEYRVAGREQLARVGPVVFCANHQSNVDPPVLFRALHPRLHILFKAELRRIPLLARAFEVGGFVAVDRRNREQAMAAIERGAQSLRDGNSFLIFPEGTRSPTDELLPFKKGGFVMAIKAQVPVVPVAVQGGRAAMRKGSALIRPVTVSVRVGEPIETKGLAVSERDRLIARVRQRIEQLLREGPV